MVDLVLNTAMTSVATQSTVIAFGVNIFLTFYVLLKLQGWNRALNRTFAILSFAFAVWNLGVAIGRPFLIYTGVFMAPPSFYAFLITLLRQFGRRQRIISTGLIIAGISLITLSYWILSRDSLPDRTFHFLNICALSQSFPVFIWAFLEVGNRIRLTPSSRERIRFIYVLIGLCAAALAGVTATITTFGYNLQSWSALAGLCYSVAMIVAIMRHRLFDFGRLASRLVIILILTLMLWMLLGVLGFFHQESGQLSFLSILVATIVLVILYDPLESLIEGHAFKMFNPGSEQMADLLDDFARDLNNFVEEDSMIYGLARTLRQSSRIQSFAVYTVDESGQSLILHDGDDIRKPPGSLISFPEPLVKTLITRRGPISRNQLSGELRGGLSRVFREERMQLYKVMNRLRASEAFPFIFGDHFFGLFTVGLEDPESDLTHKEEDLLKAISRQFATALAHAKLQAQARNREHLVALGRLASGLAHEIRNPLATIKAGIQYIQPAVHDDTNAEFMEIINEEVDRLNRFVDRFLNYAKPGPVSTDIDEAPVLATLNKLVKGYEARTECQDIHFSLTISDEVTNQNIPADAWNQLMTNLISNAIIAMDYTGNIDIVVQRLGDADFLEITVSDNGPGIPDEEKTLIFEPFFSRQEGGTGLGLAIVRQLVRRLEGEIFCTTSPSGGACFTVRLPRGA